MIDLDAIPLGGTLADLGFGEDFELLAATPDPLDFPVIGRCEEGEGVLLLHDGEPVELRGYEHFTQESDLERKRIGYASGSQSSNARSKWPRGRAPMTVTLGSPSANNITVGSDRTP